MMKGGDEGEILYNRKSALAYLTDNHCALLHQIRGLLKRQAATCFALFYIINYDFTFFKTTHKIIFPFLVKYLIFA